MYKKKKHQKTVSLASYAQSKTAELPEGYIIHNGFLSKGETPVSLVASGMVEATANGFLHIDEIEHYKTK